MLEGVWPSCPSPPPPLSFLLLLQQNFTAFPLPFFPQVSQRRQAAETESKTASLGAALARIQQDRDHVTQELVQAQARIKEADVRTKEAEAQAVKVRSGRGGGESMGSGSFCPI